MNEMKRENQTWVDILPFAMPVNMKIDGLSSTHVHLRPTIGNVSATSVDIYGKHLASERGGKHAHVWRTFLCEVFLVGKERTNVSPWNWQISGMSLKALSPLSVVNKSNTLLHTNAISIIMWSATIYHFVYIPGTMLTQWPWELDCTLCVLILGSIQIHLASILDIFVPFGAVQQCKFSGFFRCAIQRIFSIWWMNWKPSHLTEF